MKTIFYSCVIALTLASSLALAKSETEKINRLENKLSQIEKTYLQNNKEVASAVNRAESLQREAMKLRGLIDTNRHIFNSNLQESNRRYQDLDQRLRAFEERLLIMSIQVSKAVEKIAPKIAQEAALYEAGLDKIEEGAYLEAIASFKKFLAKYSKSQFAALARFWIAESYFASRDYQQAIKVYQQVIAKHAKHEKAKHAALKQARCFYRLGLHDEAKLFLEKTKKQYPHTTVASEAELFLQKISAREKASSAEENNSSSETYPQQTLQEKRGQEKKAPEKLSEKIHDGDKDHRKKDPVELDF